MVFRVALPPRRTTVPATGAPLASVMRPLRRLLVTVGKFSPTVQSEPLAGLTPNVCTPFISAVWFAGLTHGDPVGGQPTAFGKVATVVPVTRMIRYSVSVPFTSAAR